MSPKQSYGWNVLGDPIQETVATPAEVAATVTAEIATHAQTPHGTTHPDLAAHDALGLATQAELNAHAATPHGGNTRVTPLYQAADQVVTNSAVPVASNTLVTALLAATAYLVQFRILYSSATATQDFRWRFAFPALSLARQAQGFHSGLTSADASQLLNAIGTTTQWPSADVVVGGSVNDTHVLHGQFMLRNLTAGNLIFMFAQGTALTATTATLRAGSMLEVHRLTAAA